MASDLLTAVQEIRAHADDYRMAWGYYVGSVGELFTSPIVKRALKNSAASFDVNLAARPVDAVLDRLKIVGLSVPGGDEQALTDRVWTPNRMDRHVRTLHRAALVYGDAYLIVWPGPEDGTVELHYNSPVTTRAFYDEENPREIRYVGKMWSVGPKGAEITRVNLYYADRIEKYETKPGDPGETEAEFHPFVEEPVVPNPYGQVPVFHFRTDEPYGRPEHQGAFGPQNSITKLTATMMASVDFVAFPQRYALMNDTDSLIDWDDDAGVGSLNSGEASLPVERSSSLRANPGSLWRLPGASKVGEFQQADMQAFLEPLSWCTRAMASATATPLRFFDPQGAIPSGASLRADEAPLVSRIEDRQEWLGDTHSDALVFAGRVLGLNVPSVEVRWAPVEAADSVEDWQVAKLKRDLGVPFEVVMTEAGFEPETVAGWTAPREVAAAPEPAQAGQQVKGDMNDGG